MTAIVALLIVAAGSYCLRVMPFLFSGRIRLGAGTQQALRHAGMGGMTALLVTSVTGFGTADSGPAALIPACAAVATGAVVTLCRRSMTTVLLLGAGVYAVSLAGTMVAAGLMG